MLKEDELIGALVIYRQEVRPFTDKQIELVQNFAAQAVIAIENTRLLNELRQRTDDLTESLEQQTATSEVLRVISSSPGDLEPVFQAMLENATRICEAKFGVLWLYDGERFHLGAKHGVPRRFSKILDQRAILSAPVGSPLYRVLRAKAVVRSEDERSRSTLAAAARYGGARSLVAVPMFKGQELVGVFIIYRQVVRPFTDKQIELVQNFAAQAVIAIENTRLLNELRQRTDDLSEALEQQTATSEVLESHLQFAWRPGARVQGHAGERHPHLRRQVRHMYRFEGDDVPLLPRAYTPTRAHRGAQAYAASDQLENADQSRGTNEAGGPCGRSDDRLTRMSNATPQLSPLVSSAASAPFL